MKIVKEEKMQRGEFLRSLGLSTATLTAFYCMGTTLTSCGSKTEDPGPADPGDDTGIAGTITGNAVNYTVDLAKNASLKTAGGFMIIGDTILALTSAGTYVALARRCTHEGSTIQFRNAQNDFLCPTHGSQFSTTGAVEQGPAATALKVYKAALSADGNTITVTA